jgi:hypothetical protein
MTSSSRRSLYFKIVMVCIGALILIVDGSSFAVGAINPQSGFHFFLSLYGIFSIVSAFAYLFIPHVGLMFFVFPALLLTVLRLLGIDL